MAAPSDDTLMAYADGALEPEEARAVGAALAADAALAARTAMFRRSRACTRAALEPLGDEPVPDALVARILAAAQAAAPAAPVAPAAPAAPVAPAGDVVVLRLRARNRQVAAWGMSLAASLVVGVGIGVVASDRLGAPTDGLRTPAFADREFAAAMDTVPSGAETAVGDARFRAIATFAVYGGGLCREFEVDYPDRSSVVAVACRSDAAWNVTFTVASASTAEGFAAVSSLDALQGYLDAVGAAPPLAPAAEAAALSALR